MDSYEILLNLSAVIIGLLFGLFVVGGSQQFGYWLGTIWESYNPTQPVIIQDETSQELQLGRRPKGKKNKRIYNALVRMSMRRRLHPFEIYEIETLARKRDWTTLKTYYF